MFYLCVFTWHSAYLQHSLFLWCSGSWICSSWFPESLAPCWRVWVGVTFTIPTLGSCEAQFLDSPRTAANCCEWSHTGPHMDWLGVDWCYFSICAVMSHTWEPFSSLLTLKTYLLSNIQFYSQIFVILGLFIVIKLFSGLWTPEVVC